MNAYADLVVPLAVSICILTGIAALLLYRSRARLLKRTRAEENKYRSIVNTAIDGIITIDHKGIIQECNPAAEQIFGYSREELLGRNISLLMPEPMADQHNSYLENYLRSGEARIIGIGREVSGKRRNGAIFPLDLAVSRFEWEGRPMFTGVVRDITERKKIEQLKNEFVSTVSHELRTPLTSIRGALGLIRGNMLKQTPDAVKELIGIADKNTERLLLLINDILDIQKIESGEVAFHYTRTGINTLVANAVQQNLGLSEQYHVHFRVHESAREMFVYVDPDRITQVISNLLSNAAKYSPPEEDISIAVAAIVGGVRISVSDFGPGIEEEFRPRLFQKFSQFDSTNTRDAGGTGLGLAISKDIVERHNGHIDFVSHGGLGSTFFFELPLHEEHQRPADSLIRDKGFIGNRERNILIIEDDAEIAALLQRMLAEAGYQTQIAGNAQQARHILAEDHGQLRAITLDLNLPDEDGLNLLKELRQLEHTRDIPVVIVSARADDAHKHIEGAALGIVDWVNKPINQAQLRLALHQASIAGSRPRILHVENDEDIHRLVALLLQDHCRLSWAPDRASALSLLRDNDFDLALVDIGLPDGSGLDLVPLLNEKGIRIVIFSARDLSVDDASRVQSVLTKAHTRNEELLATIESLIN